MRQLFGSLALALIGFGIPAVANYFPIQTYSVMSAIGDAGSRLAAAIVSHNPKTVPDLQLAYNATLYIPSAPKVRVLVVPGHEPGYGGAEYGSIKERDLNVELASYLTDFLRGDSHFEVYTTRSSDSWAPEFADYFHNEAQSIADWESAHKAEIQDMIRVGSFKPVKPVVFHNYAKGPVAMRIYGIDKWADDNNIDIVVHIHFNDYPGHGAGPGKYTGFAIYVPEKQYYNSTTTKALAEAVSRRLAAYNPVSNLPGEESGIVEDQDLIAIGSFNSVNAPSMLVEYSYLYEPQLMNRELRPVILKDLAHETYLGIRDFLAGTSEPADIKSTLVLPHEWIGRIDDSNGSAIDIFSLQTALAADGEYPPANTTFNECPRTGKFGACTKSALQSFQLKHGIVGERGFVGSSTASLLSKIF